MFYILIWVSCFDCDAELVIPRIEQRFGGGGASSFAIGGSDCAAYGCGCRIMWRSFLGCQL